MKDLLIILVAGVNFLLGFVVHEYLNMRIKELEIEEGSRMSKIKMDLETAKWIADKAQNDISAFPVEFVECQKCGAVFMPGLGHDCDDVIELEFHDVEKEETE